MEEGTALASVQSGLPEEGCDRAMECNCYLRNVHDKMAHGKTAFQNRHGQQSDGPSLSGDVDSRLWFARVRSLRNLSQNIQKPRTTRKRRLRIFSFLVVQDRHRQQREASSKKMMLKSKRQQGKPHGRFVIHGWRHY